MASITLHAPALLQPGIKAFRESGRDKGKPRQQPEPKPLQLCAGGSRKLHRPLRPVTVKRPVHGHDPMAWNSGAGRMQPDPVGAIANFVDCAIYLAEGDYFGGALCFVSGITLGTTAIAGALLKAGKLCNGYNNVRRKRVIYGRNECRK